MNSSSRTQWYKQIAVCCALVLLAGIAFMNFKPSEAASVAHPTFMNTAIYNLRSGDGGAAGPMADNVNAVALIQASCANSYTVRQGDWLSNIARTHQIAWIVLATLNHLNNPNLIYPNQVLCLSGAAAAAAPTSQQAPQVTTSGVQLAGEFCQSGAMFVANISQWTVPPGCYSAIYTPNPANYVYRDAFGWCNWWPEVLHPNWPTILQGTRHSQAAPGSMVVFAPGEQGASPVGHYAQLIASNGNWMLISEMNDYWRGGGFGKVNYRYIHQSSGLTFIY